MLEWHEIRLKNKWLSNGNLLKEMCQSLKRHMCDIKGKIFYVRICLLMLYYEYIQRIFIIRTILLLTNFFFFFYRYIFLLNTLSGGKSCLVAPGVAVPPWATETVLSPWLAADEVRVSHVLSHVVWWKKSDSWIFLMIKILWIYSRYNIKKKVLCNI